MKFFDVFIKQAQQKVKSSPFIKNLGKLFIFKTAERSLNQVMN